MTTIKKLDNSEVEIEAEIEVDVLDKHFNEILNESVKEFETHGFRKGKAPLSLVRQKIGEKYLLDEAGLSAIEEEYLSILEKENIKAIGSPAVTIIKLALGNPLLFKIKTAVLPEFTLPDYKKIGSEVNKTKIKEEELSPTEEEIKNVLMQIRMSGMSQKEKEDKKKPAELTDELAKKLGAKGKEDLEKKVKENLTQEKTYHHKEKKRAEISEKLIASTEILLPSILVENELSKMLGEFGANIEKMGLKKEDYLKKINKSEEKLKEEWKTDAEKRVKLQLVINKISETEKLIPDRDKVKREAEHLLHHYNDASPERVLDYVEMIMTNETVFDFLENQK
ncbi:MAG: trigger factor [Patescibacteria group bacterium]